MTDDIDAMLALAADLNRAITHLKTAVESAQEAQAIRVDDRHYPIDAALYSMLIERAETEAAKGLKIGRSHKVTVAKAMFLDRRSRGNC